MQKYDFTAPANGTPQVVNVAGRYIKYVTGNAGGNDTGILVTPGGKPGSIILLYPGQAITLPQDGTAGPNAWTIANAVGAAQINGTVVVGNGKIDDNTMSGVVQVVDGGKSRTLANTAFAGISSSPPVASQYCRIQLWNPANSGKRLVVEQVWMNVGTAGMSVGIAGTQAQLATVKENGVPKLLGGASSVATLCEDATAVAATWPFMFSVGIGDTSSHQFTPNEPIVVPPGWGLTMEGNVVNNALAGGYEWYEEPNV